MKVILSVPDEGYSSTLNIISTFLLLFIDYYYMYHYTYKLCVYTHVDTHIYKDEWKLKFQVACIHMN